MSRKKATINPNNTDSYLEEDTGETGPDIFGNLKELIYLGRIERVVEIGGYRFRLTTLNGSQLMATLSKTMVHSEGERLSVLRSATLAESIVDVNGVSLETLYEKNDGLDTLGKKMHVISNLQTSIIDKLYIILAD